MSRCLVWTLARDLGVRCGGGGRQGERTRDRLRARRGGAAAGVRARRCLGCPRVAAAGRGLGRRVHRRRLGRAGGRPLLGRTRGFRPCGLRELPRGADRRACAWPGARQRHLMGRRRRAGAVPPPSPARRDPDSCRHLRRLEGVAARGGGAGPGRCRLSGADGVRGGVRSHTRPSRVVRRRSAGRVRTAPRRYGRRGSPREHEDRAGRDGRNRPARPAAAHHRPDPADLG